MIRIELPQGDDEISKAIRYLAERIGELDQRTIRMVPLGPRRKSRAEEAADANKSGEELQKIISGIKLEYVCSNPACTARFGYQLQGHCPMCRKANGEGWSVYQDQPPPVDRSAQTLADGSRVTEDHKDLRADGQQKGYVVLSEEERRKGFVRPVRRSYRHVGASGPENALRDLTPAETQRYSEFSYLKYEAYPEGDSSVTGKFWTQKDLDKIGKGCGAVTSMGLALAETYARDPGFYSGTFCSGCGTHFPVGEAGEFLWEGTNERVGT